jgi:hypothetical protein
MRHSELGIRNFQTPLLFLLCLLNLLGLGYKTVWANPTPASTVDKPAASVSVIPNPVRGKKVTFRVMADRPVKVRIRVYNRFLDTVVEFEKDGEKLFDVLWALKKVPEGIYYYQAQVTDLKTGVLVSIPVQKFVILKETKPSPR